MTDILFYELESWEIEWLKACPDVLEGEELLGEELLGEEQLLVEGAPMEKLRTVLQDHNLLRRENVIMTPHIGWYSREAQERILATTVENIRAFRAGQPVNVV